MKSKNPGSKPSRKSVNQNGLKSSAKKKATILTENELKKLLMILGDKEKHATTQEKSPDILANLVAKLEEYVKLLKENGSAMEILYRDLVTKAPRFFNDKTFYELLETEIFPILTENRNSHDPLRIWIPGAPTGELTYSIAISLFEFMRLRSINIPIKIFSTDLNELAIERGKSGAYVSDSLTDVSPELLARYFIKIPNGYRVNHEIKDVCFFSGHDLLKDPPFQRIDLICNELPLTESGTTSVKVMEIFHYSLKPTGYLIPGKLATHSSLNHLFVPTGINNIFIRKSLPSPLLYNKKIHINGGITDVTYQSTGSGQDHEADLEKETDNLLLSHYVPSSVLINDRWKVLKLRGAASKYLEYPEDKPVLNLLKMVQEEISNELKVLLDKVKKENRPARKRGIYTIFDGKRHELILEIVPVNTGTGNQCFLVVFKEGEITVRKKASQKKKREVEEPGEDDLSGSRDLFHFDIIPIVH